MLTIRNRSLPDWLHCIANGMLVGALFLTLGAVGIETFSRVSVLQWLFAGFLVGSPIAAVAAALSAHKVSIVRGIAGGDGRDVTLSCAA
jgi:hypothetical protein